MKAIPITKCKDLKESLAFYTGILDFELKDPGSSPGGLDTSSKQGSPVHQGPLDQSRGMREFYVNDPNGNTLRFGKTIE
jgi:hypothetical protein